VTAREIVKYPLIGVDANDPRGRIMVGLFARHALHCEVAIRARFGTTVCALVSHGLGVAIVDEFTLTADQWHGSGRSISSSRVRSRPASCTAGMCRCRAMRHGSRRPCTVRWRAWRGPQK
jgi:DNA-binding transcriptional LysR family regulator